MRLAYPVVFVMDGIEYPALVGKVHSAAGTDRPIVDVVAFHVHSRGEPMLASSVPYVPHDEPIPAKGRYFYETGGPSLAERDADAAARKADAEREAQEQAEHEAKLKADAEAAHAAELAAQKPAGAAEVSSSDPDTGANQAGLGISTEPIETKPIG